MQYLSAGYGDAAGAVAADNVIRVAPIFCVLFPARERVSWGRLFLSGGRSRGVYFLYRFFERSIGRGVNASSGGIGNHADGREKGIQFFDSSQCAESGAWKVPAGCA